MTCVIYSFTFFSISVYLLRLSIDLFPLLPCYQICIRWSFFFSSSSFCLCRFFPFVVICLLTTPIPLTGISLEMFLFRKSEIKSPKQNGADNKKEHAKRIKREIKPRKRKNSTSGKNIKRAYTFA